jgi:hypothetical protein
MTAARPLRLLLEIQSHGERITGRVRHQDGNEWPFSSWLGLLTLIERLRPGTSTTARPRD